MATITCLFFNHVISCFGVLKQLVLDHGQHFENEIWNELASMLGFEHQFPSYLQENGQVEYVNKIFKTMLQWTMDKHKTNWHHILFPTL